MFSIRSVRIYTVEFLVLLQLIKLNSNLSKISTTYKLGTKINLIIQNIYKIYTLYSTYPYSKEIFKMFPTAV